MATQYNEGDRVQIADRDVKPEDAKSNLFYNHYRGLTGTIQKVYATQEVAVEIELDSLPVPVSARHTEVQEQMKTKWLDGLSEEARNRLSEKERDFRLRYTILVHTNDLVAVGTHAPRVAAAPEIARPISAGHTPGAVGAPRRLTTEEYDAAEEAELERRRSGGA